MKESTIPAWNKLIFYHCGRFSTKRKIESHHHPGCELVLFQAGNCTNYLYSEEEQTFPGSPGTILVIPPGTKHYQTNHKETRTSFITFESGLETFEYPARIINVEHDRLVERWFDDICYLSENPTPGNEELIKGPLFSLLVRLILLERSDSSKTTMHPAYTKALQFMNNHYAQNINIGDIARKCGVSNGYLCLLFRQYLGISPIQHLTRLRLRSAVQLLRTPYISVNETAERCGYPDANYFIRTFKAKMNCTPAEFRRIELKRQQEGTATEKFHFPWDPDSDIIQK